MKQQLVTSLRRKWQNCINIHKAIINAHGAIAKPRIGLKYVEKSQACLGTIYMILFELCN